MESGHLRGFNNSVKGRLSAPLRNGEKPLLKGALFCVFNGNWTRQRLPVNENYEKSPVFAGFSGLGPSSGLCGVPIKKFSLKAAFKGPLISLLKTEFSDETRTILAGTFNIQM